MSVVLLSSRRIASVIAAYQPRRQEVIDRLGANGLALVRFGVTAACPPNAHSAVVMCSYVATHVAWALGPGKFEASVGAVFSADALRAGVMAVAAGECPADATACSVVERVARAAAPLAGHVPVFSVSAGGLAQPYTASDEALLVSATRGLRDRHRLSTVAGLAVGAGAGLVGPRADHLRRESVRSVGGVLLVPDADTGIWVPVDAWWADRLAEVLDSRNGNDVATTDEAEAVGASTELTTLFTKRGAARVRYAMRKATAAPTIEPSRLRSTWLVGLLNRNLPIDVVAAAAGISVGSALIVDAMLDKRHEPDEVRTWLGAHGLATSTPSTSPFAALPPIEARVGRTSTETVPERLGRYRPVDPVARELWVGPIGQQMTELIASVTNDTFIGFDMASGFCQLAGWAATIPGIPLTAEVLLRESVIQRYTAAMPGTLKDVSARSRRTHLRTLSHSLSGPPASPRPPKQVRTCRALDAGELEYLCAPDDKLGPLAGNVLDAAMVIGAGAGLEVPSGFTMTTHDLRMTNGVFELFHDSRWHPVAHRHHDAARRVATGAEAGDSKRLLTPRQWSSLRRDLTSTCGISIGSVALRHTWALHQLQRNVPASVIRQALGGSGNSLIAVAALGLAVRDTVEVTAWLAGPVALSAR